MAKQAIDGGLEMDMASGLSLEMDCYEQILNTKDRLEGLVAFSEKRKPVYRGEWIKQSFSSVDKFAFDESYKGQKHELAFVHIKPVRAYINYCCQMIWGTYWAGVLDTSLVHQIQLADQIC